MGDDELEQLLGAKPMMLPNNRRGAAPPGVPQDAWDAGELRNLISFLQRNAKPGEMRTRAAGIVPAGKKIAAQEGELEAFNHLQNLREQEAEMLEGRAQREPFRGMGAIGAAAEAMRRQLPRR
jgi:hypothetical protein